MPNSFLWIGLVGMWVFVLFPMLADLHPRIRQPTDVALSTRVLLRGGSRRKPARGPATGHDSDPNWRRATEDRRTNARGTDLEDPMDTHAEDTDIDGGIRTDDPAEDTAVRGGEPADIPAEAAADESVRRVPSSEVAELEDDFDRLTRSGEPRRDGGIPVRRGRGGFDPEADAIARAARYQFRQRVVLALLLAAIMSAAIALIVSPLAWWVSGVSVAALAGYLSYLRRQVRMEEEIRRRRTARLARSRLGVESTTDTELRLVPPRLRRPGAVIVEVDDEDPAFEHLDHARATTAEADPDDVEMRTASGQ